MSGEDLDRINKEYWEAQALTSEVHEELDRLNKERWEAYPEVVPTSEGPSPQTELQP